MSRQRLFFSLAGIAVVVLIGTAVAKSTQAKSAVESPATPDRLTISTVTVGSTAIDRYLRVTGSLAADERAEVSAEIAGRVVSTPVERGTRVAPGALLIQVSPAEAAANLEEAQANAAQIEARLGLGSDQTFDSKRVPDVRNARASLDLAEAEFDRIRSLLDQKVVSRSEFDQRRSQVEAARQQYQVAQNSAEQSFRSLRAARARIVLAQKAMADTSVRAPFAGLVAERLVSVGDYVTRGTRVASIVRIDPLRVVLTVPEQYVSLVHVGLPVRLTVDAYPGEEFKAEVRFVSPALSADQRALTVEAIAANADGRLKPGLFVTALIRQADARPALLVPTTAVETVSGTSRVYVVVNGRIQERIVTTGEAVDGRVEVTSGIAKDEVVAAEPRGRLADGQAVRPQS